MRRLKRDIFFLMFWVNFPDPRKKAAIKDKNAPQHLFPTFHTPIPIDIRHHEGRYHYEPHALHAMHRYASLSTSSFRGWI
uniref:Uncharacterized protein n=1 Tax=Cyprinodon variegatus TaxID=28743 RepID=A0A3Q2E557_CYPVA